MLAILSRPEAVWDPTTNIFSYSWLDYTDEDGDPEAACNCSAILQGDTEEIEKAALLSLSKAFLETVRIPDEYYINATQDCRCVVVLGNLIFLNQKVLNSLKFTIVMYNMHYPWYCSIFCIYRKFKISRKYLQFPLSQEEEDLPLAYSMVVHHKVQNFERLLRAIYTPQNIYCVHVDNSSAPAIHSAITAITSCFPNVFVTRQTVDVVYGGWSRVQADLNCMADLYNYSTKWKYFINLCGQDFPLKTNLEIVRMLRSLRGGNSLESVKMPDAHRWRVSKVHEIVDGNVKVILLQMLYLINRNYIRDVLEDERIQALIEWGKDTYSTGRNTLNVFFCNCKFLVLNYFAKPLLLPLSL
uniref:Uncharacterized protein n=1 Tax=Mola mola TaxID=94237 RepID=A0A3Q3WUZ6_MOLML